MGVPDLDLVEFGDEPTAEEQLAEMAANLETLQAENLMLTKLVESDSQLAALLAQIKALTRENEALRERVSGLMQEKAIAVDANSRLETLVQRLKAKR